MRTEAEHREKEPSAPSAIALLWLMLRQAIALMLSGASASASELLDKLERDLKRHILIEARKLAELERACARARARDDNQGGRDDEEPLYRIACINGRFVRIPVTQTDMRNPKIRRAAILGQAQLKRFLRAARLARHVIGAGHAYASRRLNAFLRTIIELGRVRAAQSSGAPRLIAARIRAPP